AGLPGRGAAVVKAAPSPALARGRIRSPGAGGDDETRTPRRNRPMRNLLYAAAGLAVAVALTTAPDARAQDDFITVASTTSTESSGLFDHMLPIFEQKTGIDVRVVAVGT